MSTAPRYISLGYVATPYTFTKWRPLGVPEHFFTPSPCISDLLPSCDALGWGNERKGLECLQLSPKQEESLAHDMNRLLKMKLWGLEGVFVQVDDARTVAKKWLGNASEFKLLGMALPQAWLPELLSDAAEIVDGDLNTAAGTHFAARSAQPIAEGGKTLGYEVAGLSYFGLATFTPLPA